MDLEICSIQNIAFRITSCWRGFVFPTICTHSRALSNPHNRWTTLPGAVHVRPPCVCGTCLCVCAHSCHVTRLCCTGEHRRSCRSHFNSMFIYILIVAHVSPHVASRDSPRPRIANNTHTHSHAENTHTHKSPATGCWCWCRRSLDRSKPRQRAHTNTHYTLGLINNYMFSE